ncbi:MAG: hypothetical protein ACFB0B_02580 [Thermonemataceae bacterium]
MVFILILILTIVAQLFFAWWTMPLVCFLVGLLGRRAWGTFFSGFFAVFFVWSVKAFWADIQNDQILSNRIGAMVGLGTGEWLFVFTALIGAMLGALATLAGYYTKAIFVSKKAKVSTHRATYK